jgi:FkbM family methyltransferase
MTAWAGLASAGSAAVALLPPRLVRRLPPDQAARAQLLLNRALKRRPRRFAAAPTTLGFTVDGSTSDLIQRYLYVFGVWEPDITHWLREHLRPGDVVVDIGANIGYFSLLAATAVGPTGQVIAFEPVPSIADMLERNVRRNRLPVEVRRQVVGDHDGSTEVFRSGGANIGRSGTFGEQGSTSEGSVAVVRAADAIPRELWPRIRFIKVDVEGDEQRVVRGLRPLLADLPAGAAVFVEVTPADLEARGGSAEELMTTMRDLGFDALVVRNSYAARDYAHYSRQAPVPLLATPTEQADVIFMKRRP